MKGKIIISLQLLVCALIGPFAILSGFFFSKRGFAIGTFEIANNIRLLSEVFPDSFTVNTFPHPFYIQNKYTFELYFKGSVLLKPLLLLHLIPRAENFLFIWDTGYFHDRKIDFIVLRALNKKIITMFCGDDIRSPKAYQQANTARGYDTFVNYIMNVNGYGSDSYEQNKKKVAKDALDYAHVVLNYSLDNLSSLGPIGTHYPYIIDSASYTPNLSKFTNLATIKIVHAPSNPVVKGTSLVRAAIKKLQLEGYEFEYIEIINKPNSFVLAALADSHIVLNQFYSLVPGLLGIEAMLMNNVVLMAADPELETFPDGFSNTFVKTRYWEVYDNIKYLLDNPQKLEAIASRARQFVLNNYVLSKAAAHLHELMRSHGIRV